MNLCVASGVVEAGSHVRNSLQAMHWSVAGVNAIRRCAVLSNRFVLANSSADHGAA